MQNLSCPKASWVDWFLIHSGNMFADALLSSTDFLTWLNSLMFLLLYFHLPITVLHRRFLLLLLVKAHQNLLLTLLSAYWYVLVLHAVTDMKNCNMIMRDSNVISVNVMMLFKSCNRLLCLCRIRWRFSPLCDVLWISGVRWHPQVWASSSGTSKS